MEKLGKFLQDSVFALSRKQKILFLLVVDLFLIPLSLYCAVFLSSATSLSALMSDPMGLLVLIGIMTFSGILISSALGLPRIKLNAYEQSGILRTATFAALVGMIGGLTLQLMQPVGLNARVMLIFTMVLTIFAVSARIALRTAVVKVYLSGSARHRVLIYGAGQTGVQLAAALRTDDTVEPVAFVDDNQTLHKVVVAGLPVYAPVRLEELITSKRIDRVVMAMPSISRPKQTRIARRLEEMGCEVSALPSFAALVGEGKLLDRIQPLNPSDYLNRDGLEDMLPGVCDIYTGKTVMITGAGGSIGSELTRQVMRCGPERLVLFEMNEFALYQLDREMAELASHGVEIIPVLGSVTDPAAIRRIIADYSVSIILHAAAYKHVPLVEQNQLAGLRNNVIGTKTVAEAARDAGVGHFILVSTDKAVRPTNVMGASKRFAEQIVQDLASRSDTTKFAMVRFGNVLGSSGSVVPLFEEQIARGGPVTLTHSEVTRFFMTLSEAARLVLLAGSFAGQSEDGARGEVFVLDMGAPVPIQRLARQMIEASGYSVCDSNNPDGDIEITITGLRHGEKLHEELTTEGHALEATVHPKILRTQEPKLSEIEIAAASRALQRSIEDGDQKAARAVIDRWITTSTPDVVAPAENDVKSET